jgi:hypothetical protein
MIPYIKALFTDEGRFVSVARFVLGGFGAAIIAQPDLLQGLPPLAGAFLMALAMALRSDAGAARAK